LNHRKKDESRWQSTDSSKAYRNTSAFKWSCKWMARTLVVYSDLATWKRGMFPTRILKWK